MNNRISSIDIFRALTMLLMIFVNDLWTLHAIPGWLEHTGAREDGMGLADVVFPAFLFIVGLSIPFAIDARIKRGDSRKDILLHIFTRTLALVLMGFYMVNFENIRDDVPYFIRTTWEVLMLISFMLIWNQYGQKRAGPFPVWSLRLTGVIILLMLAMFYKGGTVENPAWMSPRWWGILGLIGWAYLVCSLVYLAAHNRPWIIVAGLLVFHALNMLEFVPSGIPLPRFLLMVSASNHALVMSGVVATTLFMQLSAVKGHRFELILLSLAIVSFSYGFAVRPLWGISKIMATPSWTAICAGISFGMYLVIYLVADVWHVTAWSKPIMPAGRSTLTCYLLPGLMYPLLYPLQQLLHPAWLGGWPGLAKSLLFALLVIVLTGVLDKRKVRMKI